MKKILFATSLLFVTLISNAQTWTQKNDFGGNARDRAVCFTLNGYAYYGTGNHFGGAIETNDFWRYDALSDTWLQVANCPSGMQAGSASATVDYGYVTIAWWAGNAHANNYQYNPGTNTWSSVANWTGNLTNDGVALGIGNNIYCGTGAQPYSSNYWDDWKVYNQSTNSWSSLAVTPGTDRRNSAAFVIDGLIYWGGGQLEFSGGQGTDFYVYNPGTNSWSAIASCPSAVTGETRNSTFVLNGKGYLALSDGLWEYDPVSDSWTAYPMPFAYSVDAAFVLNGKGYIVKSNSKQVWEWTPCSNTSNAITPTACDNYTAPDGSNYTISGAYLSIIPNTSGCDSLITIDLTINNSTTSGISETVCDTYYAPDGLTYTTSGNYQAIITNNVGCDSTIDIALVVNNGSTENHTETSCDTYTAPDGTVYSSTGIYTAIIPNTVGCDSTITIDLTILESTTSTLNESAIDSYTLNGQTYTTNGTYTQTISNAAGCDSTITLNLDLEYTGLAENQTQIFVYPNPAQDILNVSAGNLIISEIRIIDITGKEILSSHDNSKTISVTQLPAGIYFIELETVLGIFRERFIKE